MATRCSTLNNPKKWSQSADLKHFSLHPFNTAIHFRHTLIWSFFQMYVHCLDSQNLWFTILSRLIYSSATTHFTCKVIYSCVLSLPLPVQLCSCAPSQLASPPHPSHINLVSTVLFSVSLHLHLIPSLVQFVLKPVAHSLLVRPFSFPTSAPCLLCSSDSPFSRGVPHILLVFFSPRFLWICSHLFCLVLLFAFWRIGLDFGHLHFTSLTFAFCCFNRPVCFFHCVKRGSVVNVASVPITGVCTTPVRG